MRSVTVLAPAKLNFALNIKGINANGYHEMDMIMQTVNLHETVVIRKSPYLRVSLPSSKVPANQFNTAILAALEFFNETGLLAGADITVHKQIPVRAGMAGGSADAAAVLVGLNELYGARLSLQELCSLGARVGADVPFAILGGTARATGIGDIIKQLPLCPPCHICVCMPPKGVSTKAAFERYDTHGSEKHPDCDKAEQALANKSLSTLCSCMYNVLQECSESEYNNIISTTLHRHGALSAMMTGSGAAVFGVFTSKQKAYNAKNELEQHYQAWVLRPVSYGAKII